MKFVMTTTPYTIGLRKDGTDLKAWLDRWVRRDIANCKLNALYEKHPGIPLLAETSGQELGMNESAGPLSDRLFCVYGQGD